MSLTCKGFDLIIVIGSLLSRSDVQAVQKMQECVQEGVKLVYLFTMEDPRFSAKSDFFSRYEVGSEEGVIALLAKAFLCDKALSPDLKTYFERLDVGYLSAESNVGEEEIEEIRSFFAKSKGALLWLGEDVLSHERAENCLRLAHTIAMHSHTIVYGSDTNYVDTGVLEPVEALKSFDGTVVYQCSKKEGEEALLLGSAQFKVAAKIDDKSVVNVSVCDEVHTCTFVQDDSLKGTIALMPRATLPSHYPYGVAKIVKAGEQ